MPSLLRRVRTTVFASPNKHSRFRPATSSESIRDQKKAADAEKVRSANHKLTRKLSTFSLRAKWRRGSIPPSVSPLLVAYDPARYDETRSGQTGRIGGLTMDSVSATEQPQSAPAAATPPVPIPRLREIANEACESALSSASAYHHPLVDSWNKTIVGNILQALIKETSTTTSQPPFKFAVNSTIIEHVPASATLEGGPTSAGKRGMHSAHGAYWNSEKDGMWTFKYDGADAKGLDVVVGIIWISA